MTTLRSTLPLAAMCLVALANPALAVDLFVKPTGSGTACVQAAPCTLATAIATAVVADSIYLAAGVYTGTGPEVVLLDRTVSLLGGWSGAPSGAVVRDPVAHESVLDGEYARRVVRITGGEPTLDGLTIRRGNASGTGQQCNASSLAACGGGVFVDRSPATITRCLIAANVADGGPQAPWRSSYGGGILGLDATGLVVSDNTIAGNAASTGSAGFGGGIAISGGTAVRITGNRITGNRGTTIEEAGWGGGIALTNNGRDIEVSGNVLSGNTASPSSSYASGNSLYTWYSSGNVHGNHMTSAGFGEAVYLGFFAGEFAGNTVLAGAEDRVVHLVNGYTHGYSLTNNVIAAGAGAQWVVHVDGYVQNPVSATLRHNTIVGNGLSAGVFVDEYGTAIMSNNIVSGHLVGTSTADNGAIVADRTLFSFNTDDGIRGSNAIDGDPRFVNAPAGDFHIQEGSAAIGAGIDTGVTADVDGDVRPGLGGIDVGADELAPRRFDFGTATSPVADGYTQVTHATAFTAERGFGWTYGTVAARDRGAANNDLRRDLCFATTANFGVTLPNGRYRVTVTMGDAAAGHGQMAVHLESRKVATVSTAGNEFRELVFETAVADGRLDVWLNDEGGADPNVVINALAIEPALPVMVDLGTAASPIAAGYARATHSTAYTPGAAFGWLGGIVQSRDRGTADPLRLDLVFSPRALLASFLPNGNYDVVVTMGDAAAAHNLMGVSVQGAAFDKVSTAKNQFVTRRYRVGVASNLLIAMLDDLEGPDVNTVLNAVEIRLPVVPRFDFGTPTSAVFEEYVPVAHSTTYTPQLGHGWLSGTIASRDRGTGDALYRDFNFTTDGTFVVDVRPGRYSVTLWIGDRTARHDQMAIELEGAGVETLTVAAGETAVRTYGLSVLDGQLTVRLVDTGGSDPNAVINGLEIR